MKKISSRIFCFSVDMSWNWSDKEKNMSLMHSADGEEDELK